MKAKSIIHFCLLTALFGVAMVLILCEELDEKLLAFFLHVIIDKILGFAIIAVAVKLLFKWGKTDSLLSRWIKMMEE